MKLKQKLTLVFLLVSMFAKAQIEGIELTPEQIKITADKICQCIEKIPNDSKSRENSVNFCFATVILTSMQEFGYMDKVSGDEEKLGQELGEKLGKKIGAQLGVYLATNCPAFLQVINERKSLSQESTEEGILTAIESQDFTFVVLKDDDKNLRRFLWLTPFKNAALLENNFKAYKGKRVKIDYKTTEAFYNAKTNKYQKYKMIVNIEILD